MFLHSQMPTTLLVVVVVLGLTHVTCLLYHYSIPLDNAQSIKPNSYYEVGVVVHTYNPSIWSVVAKVS